MSYKSRQESDNITRDCFNAADQDRSGTITIYEFYNFLQLVFQKLNIHRNINNQECEQLFRFYDDDRNGFLTPNQIVDVVWDLYTSDIMNDRVAIQQMLEKIIIEKYYNRNYNQFDSNNLYGRWGRTNTKGDWRNYRFNDYQMGKMKKFGYQFNRGNGNGNFNNFQNIGQPSNDFQQGSSFNQNQGGMGQGGFNQGGFNQGMSQGGFNQGMSQGGFNQGGFNQGGMGQGGFNQGGMGQGGFNQGGMGQGNMINLSANQNGFGMNVKVGLGNQGGFGGFGGNQGVINLSGNSGGFGGNQGGFGGNQGGFGGNQGGFGGNQGGFGGNQGGFGGNQGGFGGNQGGFGGNQGGFGGNQGGFGNQNNVRQFHTVNINAQFGQQQMLMDPFSWNQIPSFGKSPQQIVLPSPTQLDPSEYFIDLNGFGQMTEYLQQQQIALVTPIRGRQMSQYQAYQAVKQLPYLLQSKGYNGQLHFKLYFGQFVNLLDQNQFKF